ncbi:MAG TPA: prephenate dehydrogenase [Thermomicrobiales bacterium]|nr:prephenate dehydrogenase [Thermomicrobiales bacterium]
MQQITIVGLGLIGGSIGLALKRWSAEHGDALRITGFDSDMEHQSMAKKMNAVDTTTWSLQDAVSDADVVIVATPVGAMKEIFADIGPNLKAGAIVTDTGSTKADVLEWAKVLPPQISFVGGHPMAGKSQSLDGADADLFKGATWVVCPGVTASEAAIKNVLGLVAATDAEAFFADPVEHDSYVAGISHLPMVVAAALARTATSDQSWRDMRSLASTGFRDTTRLALGSPEMHRDISMTNREALSRWIGQMIGTLEEFQSNLALDDDDARERIHTFFVDAQDARAKAEVAYVRAAEQSPEATSGMKNETMSESMGRMFLGGFGRKKKDGKR